MVILILQTGKTETAGGQMCVGVYFFVCVFQMGGYTSGSDTCRDCSGQEGMSCEGELEMLPALYGCQTDFYFICFIFIYFFIIGNKMS